MQAQAMVAPPALIHDERGPQGFGPVYTLTPELLSFRSSGPLGGSIGQDIPVAAIVGFYSASYRFVSVTGAERSRVEQFLIAWREQNGVRRATWMVDICAPTFQAIVNALCGLRPDAN